MKNTFQKQLIYKKSHAQSVSVHDLLIISPDLRGDLKKFLYEKENANRSTATIAYYKQFISWFLDFLKLVDVTQAGDIKPEYVMAYNQHLKECEWQDVSIATSFRAVRAFLNWLVEVGKIKEEDYKHWRLVEPSFKKKKVRPFTVEEIKALLLLVDNRPMEGHKPEERKLCDLRDRAIILVYLDTGIRLREQTDILLSDIDLPHGIIRVNGKNGEERIVAFSPKTKAHLSKYILYRGELGYKDLHLWVNEYGRPLTRWGICSLFTRLKKLADFKSGVRCSSHTFRHTAGITALRNGMNTFVLQEMFGHKSQHQTKEYIEYLNSEDVVKAHAMYSPVQNMDI